MAQAIGFIGPQIGVWWLTAAGVAIAGCALANAQEVTLQQRYDQAIKRAKEGLLPSMPLMPVPSDASTVRVVTWTSERADIGNATDKADHRLATGDIWVSLLSEIQGRCIGFSDEERKDLPVRIKQLLGLPPSFNGGKAGGFAILEVKADGGRDLFRPCMNPDPTQTSCAAPPPRTAYNASVPHVQWMAKVVEDSYEKKPPADRFPWTQLGYTYDWAAPAAPYGVSEYIVRTGAIVKQLGWQPLEEFCVTKQ